MSQLYDRIGRIVGDTATLITVARPLHSMTKQHILSSGNELMCCFRLTPIHHHGYIHFGRFRNGKSRRIHKTVLLLVAGWYCSIVQLMVVSVSITCDRIYTRSIHQLPHRPRVISPLPTPLRTPVVSIFIFLPSLSNETEFRKK